MKGAEFCSYWIRYFLWIQISLPLHSRFLTHLTICGLAGCFSQHHGIPPSIVSDQETHITAKEVWHWAHALDLTCPHHLEVANLTEWWTAFWRFSYRASWMAESCRAEPRFSRRWYILRTSVQHIVLFLPEPELIGLEIKGWKWECHHSLLPSE